MPEITLGGERLGSGKKNKVSMHNYERSTHDLGYVWRSTMAPGTLVPFLTEVALPGDTFDINLNADVLTHPTIGPLFGTYKVQLDVFQVPIRLYQAALHMNMLGIGMDMSKILFPQLIVTGNKYDPALPIDNQQINPSCILSYLNIRGAGFDSADPSTELNQRWFNAIPLLGYWDIYKNYYANKQEEIGYVISKDLTFPIIALTDVVTSNTMPNHTDIPIGGVGTPVVIQFYYGSAIELHGTGLLGLTGDEISFELEDQGTGGIINLTAAQAFTNLRIINDSVALLEYPKAQIVTQVWKWNNTTVNAASNGTNKDAPPNLQPFALNQIDEVRILILQWPMANVFTITDTTPAPYGTSLGWVDDPSHAGYNITAASFAQQGLGIKTYQSDLFNNWISTEWIDGADGISAITAIDTSGGSFTIDELNLSNKVYNMLNRIALSGGSYDDWLDAVYTHERTRSAENPIYLGGLIKDIIFQEVVSNSETPSQPLGTLAGKGRMGQKHKGGNIVIKVDEPSYIMGIASITPNIDYSQGNKWDTNLRNMNDLHKPALDEIGFQDLITDQMGWFDTKIDADNLPIYKSAGKQPAWINYMTNVNQTRGNFAEENQQMFMTLNRRYEAHLNEDDTIDIKDLTTYIDPVKFNFIFADTRRDAQNFWVQIAIHNTARRKMSAKVIPNL